MTDRTDMIRHMQRTFHVHDQGFFRPAFAGPRELEHPFVLMRDAFFQVIPGRIIDALQSPRLRKIDLEGFVAQPGVGEFQRIAQMGAVSGDARAPQSGRVRGGGRINRLECGQQSIEPAGGVGGLERFKKHFKQGIVE